MGPCRARLPDLEAQKRAAAAARQFQDAARLAAESKAAAAALEVAEECVAQLRSQLSAVDGEEAALRQGVSEAEAAVEAAAAEAATARQRRQQAEEGGTGAGAAAAAAAAAVAADASAGAALPPQIPQVKVEEQQQQGAGAHSEEVEGKASELEVVDLEEPKGEEEEVGEAHTQVEEVQQVGGEQQEQKGEEEEEEGWREGHGEQLGALEPEGSSGSLGGAGNSVAAAAPPAPTLAAAAAAAESVGSVAPAELLPQACGVVGGGKGQQLETAGAWASPRAPAAATPPAAVGDGEGTEDGAVEDADVSSLEEVDFEDGNQTGVPAGLASRTPSAAVWGAEVPPKPAGPAAASIDLGAMAPTPAAAASSGLGSSPDGHPPADLPPASEAVQSTAAHLPASPDDDELFAGLDIQG